MKTSIATVCLSGGLSEKLQSIAAAGFRGVEIFESDLLSYNGTPADVAREMSDLGLRAITFQPFRDFEGMDTKLTHAFVYFVSLAADAFVGERLVRLRFPR